MKYIQFLLVFIILTATPHVVFAQSMGRRGQEKSVKTATLNKSLLLQLVNAARQKGCKCGDVVYSPALPLIWNERLEKAALAHSFDMFRQNYFNHTSPDGTGAGERLEMAGYQWKQYGENIGMGYKNETEVVQSWLKSPSHCKNIMNQSYKEMGVARVGNYWTQTLGLK